MKKIIKVLLVPMLHLVFGQDYKIVFSHIPIGQGTTTSDSTQIVNSIGGVISKDVSSDSFYVGSGFLKTMQSVLAEPPVISDFQFSNLIEKNGELVTVSATIFDLNGINKSELYLQVGGTNNSDIVIPMINARDHTYEALLPDSLINLQSFRARIITTDNMNSSTRSDYYTTSIRFNNNELTMESPYSGYPDGIEKNQWKLISWPAKPDNIVLAASSLDDGHVFYSWNPVKNSFSISNRIQLGESYWFRHAYDNPVVIQEDSSSSIPLEDFVIDLDSGWNLIGSPFSFPVQFEKDSVVGEPITYGLSGGTKGWSDGQSELQPWNGYAVYSSQDASMTLTPFPENDNSSSRISKPDEWYVKIKIEDGIYINYSAEIGRRKNAQDSYDVFDTPVYPELDSGLIVLTDINGTKDYNFIRDIRNSDDINGIWNLRIEGAVKQKTIMFSTELKGSAPEELNVALIDIKKRRVYSSVFNEKITISPNSNISYELKFIAGELGYVNLKTKEILDNIPSDFVLSQNYPNPFNPITKMDYELPERSMVSISIYNVLGQEIINLVNEVKDYGHHTIKWDGKDNTGKEMASGVYFTRMVSSRFSQTKKMLLIK